MGDVIINDAALHTGHPANSVLKVASADTASTDAFGRQRISQPFGLFDNKFLTSKNHYLWDEKVIGAIITHGTVTGTFSIGQTITGATSGDTGVITFVGTGYIIFNTDDSDFTVGETISTATGSATVLSHDTGADVAFQYNRASVALKLGTTQGQKIIRQTRRYFPYISGFSQLINTTQVFNEAKVGLRQIVMYGDDLNGMGIMLDGLDTKVFVRSSTSGSPVDNAVVQSLWNLDNMSGNGLDHGNPSGILLDISKNQIQTIDFQWLGIGRVRIGLNIDGKTYYVHEFDHSNVSSGVYMRTPTLPIRYEIENVTATASPSTLEQICCSVSSEGGYSIPGIEFSVSHGVVERTLASTVKTPVMAIRLKNASENGGLPVRKTIKLVNAGGFARASDVYFELCHVHGLKTFTGTWQTKDDSSAVLTSKDVTAFTAHHIHEVEGMMIPTGGSTQASGAGTVDTAIINNHIYLSQNIDCNESELFILYATSRSGTAYISTHITWVEYE